MGKFCLCIALAAALAQPVMAADITGQVQNLTIGNNAIAFQLTGSSLWFGIQANTSNSTAYAVLVTSRAISGGMTALRYSGSEFFPCLNGAPAPAPVDGVCLEVELMR
jgi:hypothetical protein